MKTIVAYCRTASASGTDPASGIMHQMNAILRYAACHGLTIHETYMEAGVSGITLERPELHRLLADCRAGKIEAVITRDPERLSHDTTQLIALLDVFQKMDVRVEFTTPTPQAHVAFLKVLVSTVAELDEATA
jgi:site-specific DNA recombinase